MTDLQRPRALRPGDRVAAVTLSWGGPGTFPHRYEAGKHQFEEAFGVEVVEMPHTLAEAAFVDAHPEARADDLHQALSDPTISGIVSTIGGDDSIRVLPHLDLELIAAHPKVLLGYSDTTVTHMAFLRAGVTSFYGPAVMSGFAENTGLDDYLVQGVRGAIFEPTTPWPWPPNVGTWTVEQLSWDEPENQERPRERRPCDGWRWHGGTTSTGPAFAACLEVLPWLRGSEWWPDLDGTVLLLETSEEAPPPDEVSRVLRSLALTGELQALAGLVLGRPGGAELPVDAHADYDRAVLQVVRDEQGLDTLPIVTGVDFGHTDPMWTIPLGVPLQVDPVAQTLTFLEAGVEPRR